MNWNEGQNSEKEKDERQNNAGEREEMRNVFILKYKLKQALQ